MKTQETNKTSTYKKIKSGFRARIEENEKKEKQKLLIIALATMLLASILLFSATYFETSAGKYTYVYGDYTQRINKSLAMSNKIQFIDMNALADYCGIERTASGSKVTYRINGTEAVFENFQNTATINGIPFEMPAKVSIKNGYCLVPISSVKELLLGVNVETSKKSVSVTLQDNSIFMIAKPHNVEYETDVSQYMSAINSKDPYIFTLVNKQNPVDESFPEDKDSLLEIPAQLRKEQTIYLYTVALQALEAMMQDMFALGYTDTYVTSAYRSYSYQDILFNIYVDREMESGLSEAAAINKVLTYSQRPGESEHQTGLCVDFTTKSIGGAVDDVFESTEVCQWLKDNAWKYGFILRYPKGKIDLTGISHESWHYRFVGLERASIIYQTGICYEEYLQYFEQGE